MLFLNIRFSRLHGMKWPKGDELQCSHILEISPANFINFQVPKKVKKVTGGPSSALWDHTALPAARHRWTRLALTPARRLYLPRAQRDGMPSWPGCKQSPTYFCSPACKNYRANVCQGPSKNLWKDKQASRSSEVMERVLGFYFADRADACYAACWMLI